MPSFLKYLDERCTPNGRGRLYWMRSDLDGLPIRAEGPLPLLTEEEWERKTEIVNDFQARMFHLHDPKQLEEYVQVMDRHYNGWYQVVRRDYRWRITQEGEWGLTVYLEWLVRCREPVVRSGP